VPGPVYAAQILLNPSLLAAAALALAPSLLAFTGFLCVVVAKSALDILQMWKLRPDPYLLRRALLVPLNDVLSGTAWLLGFWRDEVVWRGNRLRVGKETRLQPLLPLHEGVGPLGRYPHAQ
jgi:ceramide glucosyltransferase